jgi:hypothetical protein
MGLLLRMAVRRESSLIGLDESGGEDFPPDHW